MPSYPRSHYVKENEIATYHAWSRCVQRAFLCGYDPYTGDNYDYRRDWIEGLLAYQAAVFAVDLGNYNILSNHHHVIVRTRPDISATWSDEEVAWRWKMAWPEWNGKSWQREPTDEEIRQLLAAPPQIFSARKNLASLSWFMARVKEPIAKLANREMNRKGHFFEQRFKCRRLEDPAAVLTASVYLDVNQIAAEMSPSLESSRCSAIRRRLAEWRREQAIESWELFHRGNRPDLKLDVEEVEQLLDCDFLSPISEKGPLILVKDLATEPYILVSQTHSSSAIVAAPAKSFAVDQSSATDEMTGADDGAPPAESAVGVSETAMEASPPAQPPPEQLPSSSGPPRLSRDERSAAPATYEIHGRQKRKQRRRASDNPFLDVQKEQYWTLVTWTAARIKGPLGTSEDMPIEAQAVLKSLGVDAGRWLTTVSTFQVQFHLAVGAVRSLDKFLLRTGRATMHGIRACRSAFT